MATLKVQIDQKTSVAIDKDQATGGLSLHLKHGVLINKQLVLPLTADQKKALIALLSE